MKKLFSTFVFIALFLKWQLGVSQITPPSPVLNSFTPVSPNLDQKNNSPNYLPIKAGRIEVNHQEQFQRASLEFRRQKQTIRKGTFLLVARIDFSNSIAGAILNLC